MEVKLMVYSKELSSEELLALLQAIRDCEMRNFKDKVIAIIIDSPQLTGNEAVELLGKIKPPFARRWELPDPPLPTMDHGGQG